MSVRSRASLVPPLSLYLFLDLITALSGVLVLITMFLTTYLDEGSPLFPGSAQRSEPALESELRGRLLEREKELRNAEELAEKEKWATLSPREIRRLLRRLQGLASGEGPDAAGEKTMEQCLAERGLQDLGEQVKSAEKNLQKRESEIHASREKHEALDRQVREAQATQVGALGADRGIRLVRDGRDTTKRPIVVELAHAQFKLFPLDQPSSMLTFERSDRAVLRLRQELFAYPPDSHFVFLLVQPSGYEWFPAVRSALQSLGYEVGFDGIPEDPRLFLPDMAPNPSPGFSSRSVLGDPEPWPVEGRENP
ncbi:MAG: hypothetical protein EBT57_06305 [Verrucomicrobia bacterium]|nr:hypothetical protein [Verrucomicrobiota bacterium]